MWRSRTRARVAAAVLLAALLAGCGGDDGASDRAPASATTAVPSASGASGAAGKLPDACTLIDDATAGAAMAGTVVTKAAPQAANEVSSRCMWAGGGAYSMSLLVRRGNDAKSSFDNVVSSGFVATTLAGSDARVSLGAPDTARDYRLVSYAAYNGAHFVHVVLQGRNRADAAATESAAGLVKAALSKL